jgi:hypothetical protein
VLTSFIVLVLVLVAGVFLGGGQPPWALQPAMVARRIGTGVSRYPDGGLLMEVRLREEDADETSIVMDSLRVLGLVRRDVERPVVGRRAYVRLWERVRAVIVLGAIIVGIGVTLAATIGVLVLAAGFLLEQAIA